MKSKVLVTLMVLCIVASAAMFLHGTRALNKAIQYGLGGYGTGLGAGYGGLYGGLNKPALDFRNAGGYGYGGGYGGYGSAPGMQPYRRSTQRHKSELTESAFPSTMMGDPSLGLIPFF